METGHGLTKKQKRALVILGTATAVYIGFKYLLSLFVPFLIAYFIAWILRPLAGFLKKKLHIPIFIGAILGVFLLFIFVFVSVFFLVRTVIREGILFAKNLPVYLTYVASILETGCDKIEKTFDLRSGMLNQFFADATARVEEKITAEYMPLLASKAIKLFSSLGGLLTILVIIVIASIFFVKDMQEYKTGLRKSEFYPVVHKITKKLSDTGIAYLKTQLAIMSIIAVIVSLAFILIKNPYAILIGIFVGIFDAFPVLGSGFILVPWGIASLLQKDLVAGAIILTAYAVCQITREILEPRLLGNRIKIQPIYNLIAMYVGVRVFGILGFFLGPIALVIIRFVVQENCRSDIYC